MQTPFFLESRISLQHQRISPARHTRLPRPFRARALSTRPILPFFSRTLEIRDRPMPLSGANKIWKARLREELLSSGH